MRINILVLSGYIPTKLEEGEVNDHFLMHTAKE
jgi:hypothetical protein